MRKQLFFLTALFASFAMSWAFPVGGKSNDPIPIPITTKPIPSSSDPHAPSITPFSVLYDSDMGTVSISTIAPMGIISVEFENLSTGTLITDSFDSTYPGVFFLPNESGTWDITLILPSGATFGGSFSN